MKKIKFEFSEFLGAGLVIDTFVFVSVWLLLILNEAITITRMTTVSLILGLIIIIINPIFRTIQINKLEKRIKELERANDGRE